MIVFTGGSSPLGLEIINNLKESDKVLGIYNKNKVEEKSKNIEWVKIDFFEQFDSDVITSKLNGHSKVTLVCFAAYSTDELLVNLEYTDWQKTHKINLDTNFILTNEIKSYYHKLLNYFFPNELNW